MISRRKLLAGLALGPLALAGLGTYAAAVEPRFRLVRTSWRPAPAAWPGDVPLRIVALADIHMGPPSMTPDRLAYIVEQAMVLRPDLVVLLGDYAAGHRFVTRQVPPGETASVLARLSAPLGVHAILGNHDWWEDPTMIPGRRNVWHRTLEDVGIPVLENRATPLTWRGTRFWLAGLGSQTAYPGGADDLDGTLAQVTDDAPLILLAHEPDIFARMPARVALTLSGHTHGGQVRLFGQSPMVPSRYGNRCAYGLVTEEGRHLVVSGGLGCSIVPIRFGMPPEITVIELGDGVAT